MDIDFPEPSFSSFPKLWDTTAPSPPPPAQTRVWGNHQIMVQQGGTLFSLFTQVQAKPPQVEAQEFIQALPGLTVIEREGFLAYLAKRFPPHSYEYQVLVELARRGPQQALVAARTAIHSQPDQLLPIVKLFIAGSHHLGLGILFQDLAPKQQVQMLVVLEEHGLFYLTRPYWVALNRKELCSHFDCLDVGTKKRIGLQLLSIAEWYWKQVVYPLYQRMATPSAELLQRLTPIVQSLAHSSALSLDKQVEEVMQRLEAISNFSFISETEYRAIADALALCLDLYPTGFGFCGDCAFLSSPQASALFPGKQAIQWIAEYHTLFIMQRAACTSTSSLWRLAFNFIVDKESSCLVDRRDNRHATFFLFHSMCVVLSSITPSDTVFIALIEEAKAYSLARWAGGFENISAELQTFLLSFERFVFDGIKQRIANLKPKEFFLLPGGWAGMWWEGHVCYYLISGEEKGTYSVQVINSGKGLNYHARGVFPFQREEMISPVVHVAGIDQREVQRYLSLVWKISKSDWEGCLFPIVTRLSAPSEQVNKFAELSLHQIYGFLLKLVNTGKARLEPCQQYVSPQHASNCTTEILKRCLRVVTPAKVYTYRVRLLKILFAVQYAPGLKAAGVWNEVRQSLYQTLLSQLTQQALKDAPDDAIRYQLQRQEPILSKYIVEKTTQALIRWGSANDCDAYVKKLAPVAPHLAIDCVMAFWLAGRWAEAKPLGQFLIKELLSYLQTNPKAEPEVIKRFGLYSNCLQLDGLWTELKGQNPTLTNEWITWLTQRGLYDVLGLIT